MPTPRSFPAALCVLLVASWSAVTPAHAEPADPVIEEAGELSISRLVEEVLRRNPSVIEATQTLNAALAMYPQAVALEDPTFSYALAPGTIGRPEMGSGPGASHFDLGQRFEIEQSFPWPGKLRLRGQAASQEAESERGNLEAVREELSLETKAAFYELWYAYRAAEINATNQELLLNFRNIAETRYAAGVVTKQDALQAGVEHDHLLHEAVVLERMRRTISARINVLLDRPTGADLPPPPQKIGDPLPLPGLDALQEKAAASRPELDASLSRIHAGETRVQLAHKEFYPDFSVMVGYDRFWQESQLQPMIGFSLNLPVQLGRRRGAMNEAQAQLSGLEAARRRTRQEIALQVHTALEEAIENHHAIELYEARLLPSASENLEAARTGYSAGEIDLLALITAQKLLMDTTLRLEEARASYHQSIARLERAVGASLTTMLATAE